MGPSAYRTITFSFVACGQLPPSTRIIGVQLCELIARYQELAVLIQHLYQAQRATPVGVLLSVTRRVVSSDFLIDFDPLLFQLHQSDDGALDARLALLRHAKKRSCRRGPFTACSGLGD